jgi:hypothetical protein
MTASETVTVSVTCPTSSFSDAFVISPALTSAGVIAVRKPAASA